MRKLICLLSAVLIIVLLSGCEDYPLIRYHDSSYNLNRNNREITIKDGYTLNQAHSYDVIETENGYSITLHFVKEDTEVKDDE